MFSRLSNVASSLSAAATNFRAKIYSLLGGKIDNPEIEQRLQQLKTNMNYTTYRSSMVIAAHGACVSQINSKLITDIDEFAAFVKIMHNDTGFYGILRNNYDLSLVHPGNPGVTDANSIEECSRIRLVITFADALKAAFSMTSSSSSSAAASSSATESYNSCQPYSFMTRIRQTINTVLALGLKHDITLLYGTAFTSNSDKFKITQLLNLSKPHILNIPQLYDCENTGDSREQIRRFRSNPNRNECNRDTIGGLFISAGEVCNVRDDTGFSFTFTEPLNILNSGELKDINLILKSSKGTINVDTSGLLSKYYEFINHWNITYGAIYPLLKIKMTSDSTDDMFKITRLNSICANILVNIILRYIDGKPITNIEDFLQELNLKLYMISFTCKDFTTENLPIYLIVQMSKYVTDNTPANSQIGSDVPEIRTSNLKVIDATTLTNDAINKKINEQLRQNNISIQSLDDFLQESIDKDGIDEIAAEEIAAEEANERDKGVAINKEIAEDVYVKLLRTGDENLLNILERRQLEQRQLEQRQQLQLERELAQKQDQEYSSNKRRKPGIGGKRRTKRNKKTIKSNKPNKKSNNKYNKNKPNKKSNKKTNKRN